MVYLIKQDIGVEIHGFHHNLDAFEQMKAVRISRYLSRGVWFVTQLHVDSDQMHRL